MSNAQISFDNPGGLLASLPAVLGFVPEKSLILVSLEQNRLGAVLRVDLSENPIDHVAQLAAVTATSGSDSAILVVVDDNEALCPMCNEDHRRLGAALAAALAEHEIGMAAQYVVDAITAGGNWRCLDGFGQGTCGKVDDPGSSPMAAAAVLDGRRLYGRREELREVISVDDPARTAALAAAIAECGNDLNGQAAVMEAEAAVSLVCRGPELDNTEIANLACSLADGAVRDALYGLAAGPAAGRVEDTFAWLSRTLPEPWRADALSLHAFLAFCRGDGPLAGLSLETALTINPAHRMATLLNTALRSGLHPNRIRELAQSQSSRSETDHRFGI